MSLVDVLSGEYNVFLDGRRLYFKREQDGDVRFPKREYGGKLSSRAQNMVLAGLLGRGVHQVTLTEQGFSVVIPERNE